MTIEISAFIFAVLTGFVAVRYEGTVTSRIAVVMLLGAAGGSLAGGAYEIGAKFDSLWSIVALVFGHIASELVFKKVISTKHSNGAAPTINNTNDLLALMASNKDLNLETELSVKIK
jgi:uncharacterized membrane protein YfcA